LLACSLDACRFALLTFASIFYEYRKIQGKDLIFYMLCVTPLAIGAVVLQQFQLFCRNLKLYLKVHPFHKIDFWETKKK
jgi:hypothetical protein